MDPIANLKEQLRVAKDITMVWDDCNDDGSLRPGQAEHVANQANRLAELVISLDEWIVKGGFLPTRWQREVGK